MARGRADRDVLDRIFEKAAANPRGRSDLAKFLTRNHDEFAERLATGLVSWQGLADAFDEQGLLKRTGKLPPAELLRLTWARVTKRVQAARAGGGRKASIRKSADRSQAAPRASEPSPSVEPPLTDEALGEADVVLPPLNTNRRTRGSE